MKKILALILSAAVLFSTYAAIIVSGEGEKLWQYIDGASNTVVTETDSGVYSAENTSRGFRVMTTQKFDPRDKKVSVVLGDTPGGWYTFGIVGSDGNVATMGNTQNGLDFVIYYDVANSNYRLHFWRNGACALSYGNHPIRDVSVAHTFGFDRFEGNWYLTIDGEIVNTDVVHSEINKVLDNNSEVYFVIGAQSTASFTDLKIVDNDEFQAWLPLSGETDILKGDSGYNLSGSGEVISADLYDVEKYELSFVSGAVANASLYLGVAAEDSDGNLIQKGIAAEINGESSKLGFFGAEGSFDLGLTADIAPDVSHTFSIVEREGVFYPALDGVIVNFPSDEAWQNRLTEFSEFIKSNGSKLKFTLSGDSGFNLTNVKLVLAKSQLVAHKANNADNDYTGTVTLQDSNGLTLSGKSSFITSEAYNVEKYDLSFKVTEASEWINLAVTKADNLDNIGKPIEDISASATRVDFLIKVSDGKLYVKEAADGATDYTDLYYSEQVTALNTAHTFGLREVGGHWYPAVDGVTCTSAVSARLDAFMAENGSSSLRFAIGGNGTDNFKAENVGVVKNAQKVFVNNDPHNTASVINQPNGLVTLSGGWWADLFTTEAYDITEQELTFTVGDMAKGRFYLSLAAPTGEISSAIGGDFDNPTRLDFQVSIDSANNYFLISYKASSGANQSQFNGATAYLKNNFKNKTHTFGLREVDGQWYPAIDGFVYSEAPAKGPESALKLINDFVNEHGTELRFGVASNHEITSFTLTDVGVTDIKDFAAQGNTAGTVEIGEDGYSNLTVEKGIFLTTDSYNVEEYDLQFDLESVPTEYIWLSVTAPDLPTNISTSFGSNFTDVSRIDFMIYPRYNQIVIRFPSTNGSAPQAEFTAAGSNLSKSLKLTAHTFGLREIDGHWYPALDGTTYTVTNKDSQNPTKILDDFMNNRSDLRFGIGGNSTFSVKAKMVEYNTLWGAYSGGGVVNKEVDGVTSADDFYLSIRTVDTYDITQNDIQFNITEYTGDWVRFGLAVADDSATLGESMLFIARFGKKGALSYLVNGKESRIYNLKYDLDTVHTFGVRELDGHWYPAIDGYIVNTKSNDDFDKFINEHKDEGFRFVLGAHNFFSAKDIKIIDAVESVEMPLTGFDIYGSNASLEGNEADGYTCSQTKDFTFAFSNAKYDMRTTSLSFKVNDVGEYIYFSVSAGDARTSGVLATGDDPPRFIFILRPIASDNKIQPAYWNIDGVTAKERAITTRNFNWFDTHTVDVRQIDENWFICIDGFIYQSRVSTVFNNFMNKHIDEGLNYGIGGAGTLNLTEIKVIDQVPLSEEAEALYEDGTLEDDNVEWGFDFGYDSDDGYSFDDYFNTNDDISFDFSDNDQDMTFTGVDSDVSEDDASPNIIGRVKKKKLVSAGHGYIFEWYEILAMVSGGVLLAGGITVAVVLVVKRRKRKS